MSIILCRPHDGTNGPRHIHHAGHIRFKIRKGSANRKKLPATRLCLNSILSFDCLARNTTQSSTYNTTPPILTPMLIHTTPHILTPTTSPTLTPILVPVTPHNLTENYHLVKYQGCIQGTDENEFRLALHQSFTQKCDISTSAGRSVSKANLPPDRA